MVPVKFASLVLAFLFASHALRDPSAYAHKGTEMRGNGITVTGKKFESVQKELLDDVPAAAAARKMERRGRKMVVGDMMRKEIQRDKGLNEETSKISGEDMNASERSLGKSQDHANNQKNSYALEPKTMKSGSLGISGSSSSDDEWKRLVDAANEIVSLIHKDYRGMGKAGRKPPINNHKPTD